MFYLSLFFNQSPLDGKEKCCFYGEYALFEEEHFRKRKSAIPNRLVD